MKILSAYAYIYGLIRQRNNPNDIISDKVIFEATKRMIYRAPQRFFRTVIDELEYDLKLIKEVSPNKYMILKNREAERMVKKLNEAYFPIEALS